MDVYEAVAPALAATEILSERAYAWLGRRFDEPSCGPAREVLLHRLTDRLYTDFYCRGRPVPADLGPRPDSQGGPFAEALSTANRGEGSWEPGWAVVEPDEESVIVVRGGLHVWADYQDVASPGGDPLLPGAPVSVRLPKEMRRLVPGFYTALGNRGLPHGPVLRVYWHLTSRAAAPFVERTTELLNAVGIPFRLKVVDVPERFNRCDSGVLYLLRSDAQAVAPHVAAVHRELASVLRPLTPVFTRRLAPGLACADEPGDGESFGVHRCRLLAEGIIRAHERGVQGLDSRACIVAEHFAEAGINSRAPHLEPGSSDVATPLE